MPIEKSPSAGELFLRNYNRDSRETWEDFTIMRYRMIASGDEWDECVFLPTDLLDDEDDEKFSDGDLPGTLDSSRTIEDFFKSPESYSERDHSIQIINDESYAFALGTILAAWRPNQSIVKFDGHAISKIMDNSISDESAEVIWGLPDWTIYFDVPLEDDGHSCTGFFANNDLTYGYEESKEYLMLAFIKGDENCILRFPIENTVRYSFDHRVAEHILDDALKEKPFAKEITAKMIKEALKLVAYVVKYGFDTGVEWCKIVTYPQPKKVKRGLQFFPAKKPAVYILGKYAADLK